ncbi:PRK06851 family protein [Paraliobacillus sp. JSM ZJ581]|uniref:PRK06851 family protein n=1 Tax=Paraliobacillus sp. JSM ZJ581 TaxID=3342118 RepID=UPI0035A86FC5
MTGKKVSYFAGGNTAKGFYNLLESNLQGIEVIYTLIGGPGNGKSSLIKRLASTWSEKGYDIEQIYCSFDHDKLAGLIIPSLKCAIIDATHPKGFKPKAPGAIEQYVNLGVAWDTSLLSTQRQAILNYEKQKSETLELAYQSFERGLLIHDELESVYINNIDFKKADQVTKELIEKLFTGKKSKLSDAITRHRFFGASTPNGVVDFIANITEGLNKRFFIKGRAGTGKSTLLKKIAATATERDFDVEVYHCGFDPESIDMIIIRELSVCLFDSTDPHEYFPNRHGDEIVDLYEKTVAPGTDEANEYEINTLNKRYKQRMKEGIGYLQEAKTIHDQLKKIYVDSTDFSVIDAIYKDIYRSIEKCQNF